MFIAPAQVRCISCIIKTYNMGMNMVMCFYIKVYMVTVVFLYFQGTQNLMEVFSYILGKTSVEI